MREIKFRAWIHGPTGHMVQDWAHIAKDGSFGGEGTDTWIPDHRISVMQYTGLQDCNDIDIYEGDIVRVEIEASGRNRKTFGVDEDRLEIAVIKWSEEDMCFYAEFRPAQKWHPLYDYVRFADVAPEIIGNIHANPELLKATGKE